MQIASSEARVYVRVLGVRRGHFVLFELAFGDADLAVELVLPFPAFMEFCHARGAELADVPSAISDELDTVGWKHGVPNAFRLCGKQLPQMRGES